ncbi:MAG: HAD-IA family hydrolase [Thermoleophilia bacterium]
MLFGMDGVVTDTAASHAAAWKQLLDGVIRHPRARPGDATPFDAHLDYRRFVDGRASEDGMAAFLTARGIAMPLGSSADPPGAWTVHGQASMVDGLLTARFARDGVRVFPGTAALLQRLRDGGVPVALVTGSRHAASILQTAELSGAFDVVIDGEVARTLGLRGKPDPDTLLEAAARLGVSPERSAVVEDAAAGVEAARRGRFGLVVGIDRGGNRDLLESAGADFVLGDVGELDLGVARSDPWLLVYDGFDPEHEGHRETLTTLGNGYMATRGAAPERVDDGVHYPGTYLAGVYNRLTSTVGERHVVDEHMVNAPNWLVLDVRIDDLPWLSANGLVVRWERRELDLRRAVLTRRAVLAAPDGRELELLQRRLVSMHRPHIAALQTVLTPRGWSGRLGVRSAVDVAVENTNVAEYAALESRHLVPVNCELVDPDTLLVEVETSQSHHRIAVAARTTLLGAGDVRRPRPAGEDGCGVGLAFAVTDGRAVTIDKTVAITSSRDRAIGSPADAALTELDEVREGLSALLGEHEAAWRRLWDLFEVEVDADSQTMLSLNIHVFHLLQTLSPHAIELDAGVPARGLHGEGYRGHVFWDELFVLPMVTLRLPRVARAVLDYRWRRLDAARRSARRAGLRGALFPWQSGSDGREETPRQLYNPRSRRWIPDNSHRQRHVGLAVAHNAWQYFQASGDTDWLADHGSELIVEVARLFASMVAHDPSDDRFHLDGVMGPDEYHDGPPGAPGVGLRDNAYTNVLAAWLFETAGELLRALSGHDCDSVIDRLALSEDEVARWDLLSRRLAVPFHADGVISQFAGYEDLEELDWSRYRSTYGNIERLDLILEAEGDSTNRYRLSKQADVLMLIHVLGPDRLIATLSRLGYEAGPDALGRTVEHYLPRTAHGSTLSRVVHSSVLSHTDPAKAWTLFREALDADLDDTQGGTTREGIHLGAMAGTVDLAIRAIAGLEIGADVLVFKPRLPADLRRVTFRVRYRGQRIVASLDHRRLVLVADPCNARPIDVAVCASRFRLGGGERRAVPWASGTVRQERGSRAEASSPDRRRLDQGEGDAS